MLNVAPVFHFPLISHEQRNYKDVCCMSVSMRGS